MAEEEDEEEEPGVPVSTLRRAPVESAEGDCIGCGDYILQGRPRFRKTSENPKTNPCRNPETNPNRNPKTDPKTNPETDLCPTCMEQLRESAKEEDEESIPEEYMGIDETTAESSSREETGNSLPESSAAAATAGAAAGAGEQNSGREQNFAIDHRHLVDWVWNYFAGKAETATSSSSSSSASQGAKITMSDRSPLYFQHKGHSRPVIGIERKQQIIAAADPSPAAATAGGSSSRCCSSSSKEDFILILDPSERTQDIVNSLRAKTGWQKLLKRSTQTLQHPEYQLCYVEPGIVRAEELEDLKLLSSVHYTY